jgi:hypothetical protein
MRGQVVESEEDRIVSLEDEFVIGELVRSIIEQLKQEMENEEDPFEQYNKILRLKVLSEDLRVRQRIINGFKVIAKHMG